MRKVYAMKESDSGLARGGSVSIDVSTQSRGSAFHLKRSSSSDRENAGNGKYYGDHSEFAAREGALLDYRTKSAQFRSFKGDRIDGSFRKSSLEVYKIAIVVIATCFLAITVMQGSMVLILKHTAFLTIPGGEESNSFENFEDMPGTEGLSTCERAVKAAIQNFTEHLQRTVSHAGARHPGMWKLEQTTRRPPRLALICPDLQDVPHTLYLSTIARGLQWLGYNLVLYAQHDGYMRQVWDTCGVPVYFVDGDWRNITVDWSLFEGVLAVSLDAKKTLESLAQDPFGDIPVVWIIPEIVVLDQDMAWNASAELETVYSNWFQIFNRSSVVVFPNYFLPIVYNNFYNGRFYVIAGSPWDIWEAQQYMMTHARQVIRAETGLRVDDFAIVVVGNPCPNKETWREHAIVMKAVANLSSSSIQLDGKLGQMKLFFLGRGNSTGGYEDALQMMARQFGLKDGLVKHVGVDEDVDGLLWMADAVVYASVWEELSFPPILIRAMSFERPVVVPDLVAISQQIVDRESGFLFSAGDDEALAQALSVVGSNPALALEVGSGGASLARDLLARDVVVEYGYLLEKLLEFPEAAHFPRPTAEIQELIPPGWRWDLLGEAGTTVANHTQKDLMYLKTATDLRFMSNETDREAPEGYSVQIFDWFSDVDWNQEKESVVNETWEEVEDELVKDRLVKVHTSLEDVNKMVKKAETRISQEKHLEIDHLEVERVAQPLAIYEPYLGSGAWPFLHRNHLLYRGLSLSGEARRPFLDDLDGASRLRLLNNTYYRDVICDVAGFFSLAKLIDRVHRNPWIGFQPWRARSKQVALTPPGEAALLAAVSAEKDGDAIYFWAQIESKDSEPAEDFWSSCDLANAGNCRSVFLDTFKLMYGLPSTWTLVPSMPAEGGTWAAMHCWAMPTTSFLEFVMFARMFVDALDALQYEDHHDRGRCCFSGSKVEVKHCYCNFLEGLVNVWAYHSARRMIYVDPQSGFMEEQHTLESRNGTIWVKWFQGNLLKSMDEDLAEEVDDDPPNKRRLWPETGEVFWAGTKEKERRERFEAKIERKRRQLERQARQTKYRQKTIGKYSKPKATKKRRT